MKKNIVRFLILAVIGFGLGAAIAYFEMKKDTPPAVASEQAVQQTEQQVTQTASEFKGEFSLIADADSDAITLETFEGIEKLVFFGFTHCPDVCPSTLTKIAEVLEGLDKNIPAFFITVDPARDTPEVMQEYTSAFDPRIIGLTGDQQSIDAAVNSFKAYAAKDAPADDAPVDDAHDHSHDHAQGEEMAEGQNDAYLMQHSSFVYLLGKDNNLLEIINSGDTSEEMLAEVKQHVQ